MNILDLYRLMAQHDDKGAWNVGLCAMKEILWARDSGGFYLVAPPHDPWEEPKLLGMPIRVDRSLPEGRIELHDRNDRVLGAIDNVGP